jgi:hypothetical protein
MTGSRPESLRPKLCLPRPLYYNHWCIPTPEIKVRDQVWVYMSDIRTTSAKFWDKWLGPFKVVKVVGKGAYKLELPPWCSQIHLVVKLELCQQWPLGRLNSE